LSKLPRESSQGGKPKQFTTVLARTSPPNRSFLPHLWKMAAGWHLSAFTGIRDNMAY